MGPVAAATKSIAVSDPSAQFGALRADEKSTKLIAACASSDCANGTFLQKSRHSTANAGPTTSAREEGK